jgi:hypothetical protein
VACSPVDEKVSAQRRYEDFSEDVKARLDG